MSSEHVKRKDATARKIRDRTGELAPIRSVDAASTEPHECRMLFGLLLHVNAHSPNSLRAQLAGLAQILGLPEPAALRKLSPDKRAALQ